MNRYALLVLTLFTVPCAAATAQIKGDKVLSVRIDGDAPEGLFYINAALCDKNADVQVRLQNLGSPGFLEVWRSSSEENCHAAAGRTVQAGGKDPACTRIGEPLQSPGSSPTVLLKAADLATQNKPCDQGGTQKVYFVPLENATPEGAASGVSEGLGDPSWVTFTVDVIPPSAPSNLSGEDGENRISVKWKGTDNSDTADGATVYYDPSGISKADADCTSELLMAKKALESTEGLEASREAAGTTESSISPDSLGLKTGEQIPVAVVSRDKAGNRSLLSEVICLRRIDTDGFIDRYDEAEGNGLEKCSMQAPGRASFSGLGSLTFLALALVARRRRTA